MEWLMRWQGGFHGHSTGRPGHPGNGMVMVWHVRVKSVCMSCLEKQWDCCIPDEFGKTIAMGLIQPAQEIENGWCRKGFA